jgi:hypothetical protein
MMKVRNIKNFKMLERMKIRHSMLYDLFCSNIDKIFELNSIEAKKKEETFFSSKTDRGSYSRGSINDFGIKKKTFVNAEKRTSFADGLLVSSEKFLDEIKEVYDRKSTGSNKRFLDTKNLAINQLRNLEKLEEVANK